MLDNNNSFFTATSFDIVSDYCMLPLLPTNQQVTVAKFGKIASFNDDKLTYNLFTKLHPTEFPRGKTPEYDYMPDEFVRPIVIEDINGVFYRTPMNLWFVLDDIANGITFKQDHIQKNILPFTVFIEENYGLDKNNNWLVKMMNFVGIQFINQSIDAMY
jgi:hypothetical protein